MQFFILIALVTFLWGLSFPTMKIGLNVMAPFMFLLLRALVSSATLFGLMALRGRAMRPPPGRPEFWWNALLHNLMFLFCYYGASLTTSGRTSVFLYTQPLFYAALAVWFVPTERFGLRSLLGFSAAFGGIVVMFGEKLAGGGESSLAGDALVLLAALIWGIQSFYLRQKLKGIDPFRISAWTQLAAVPIFLLLALLQGAAIPDFWSRDVLISVGYNGIVGTGLVMVLWVLLLAEYPPTRVSAFMFLTPVFGVFLSALILTEPLTGFMLAGALLVAGGIYLVNTDRGRRGKALQNTPPRG